MLLFSKMVSSPLYFLENLLLIICSVSIQFAFAFIINLFMFMILSILIFIFPADIKFIFYRAHQKKSLYIYFFLLCYFALIKVLCLKLYFLQHPYLYPCPYSFKSINYSKLLLPLITSKFVFCFSHCQTNLQSENYYSHVFTAFSNMLFLTANIILISSSIREMK